MNDAYLKAVRSLLSPRGHKSSPVASRAPATLYEVVRSLLAPRGSKAAVNQRFATTTNVTFEIESINKTDGVLIASAPDADGDNDLKEAAWALSESAGGATIEVDGKAIGCDIVGVWFGEPLETDTAYVMLKPHDSAIFKSLKSGAAIVVSW